jgi:hypothetical protein
MVVDGPQHNERNLSPTINSRSWCEQPRRLARAARVRSECARNESVRITPRFWRQVVAVLDLATRCSNHGVIGPNASRSWVQTTYLVVNPGSGLVVEATPARLTRSHAKFELRTYHRWHAPGWSGENEARVDHRNNGHRARSTDLDVHVSKMCIL